MAVIKLRTDKLAELRAVTDLHSDAELARRAGIHQSSLTRVIAGNTEPGTRVIAGLLKVFGGPSWFEQLFLIVDDKAS